MERHFHEELGSLKDKLVAMARAAETMIEDAVRLLTGPDRELVASLEAREAEVNRLQCEVDDQATRLIALHQPTASDLRFILGCIKTNADLERLADEAINVSHKAVRLTACGNPEECRVIVEMGGIAASMVREGIRVFVSGSSGEARDLILRDRELNALKKEVTAKMTAAMKAQPDKIQAALDVLLASRNLERIGDHVKNIAENAIFIREGRDVRHKYSDAEKTD
jgi:phosphate transport system protein